MEKDKINMLKNIARNIGSFYYYKNYNQGISHNDVANITNKEIKCLGITDLDIEGQSVYITLQYPGLIIGFKGINIQKLTIFLTKVFGYKININIIENQLLNSLYINTDDYE